MHSENKQIGDSFVMCIVLPTSLVNVYSFLHILEHNLFELLNMFAAEAKKQKSKRGIVTPLLLSRQRSAIGSK